MRSRDGNYSFLFSIFTTIIFFTSSILYGEEYLISYRYVVKNAVLYNEQLFISQAMQKCEGIPYEKIILNNPKHKTLQQLLKEPDSPFFDYIKKIGFYIQSYNTANNFQIQSTTIVTLKTTCFKVDFNEDFVTIEHIK